MGIAFAAAVGYALGSLPTAVWLGRLAGVDLRRQGSRNPGTNNALRTGGPLLAAGVLLVEAAKGWLAVWLGGLLGGDPGAVAAGLAAVSGNVYNVWLRFEGGKGLGISLGVLAGLWPLSLVPTVVVLVVTVLVTRSAGIAALAAMAGLVLFGVATWALAWPTGGVAPTWCPLIAIGLTLVMAYKHWRDSPLNPAFQPMPRESA